MRLIDIGKNRIVLRFLDNIIVTSGYKSCLECLMIEGNHKVYGGNNAGCCMSTKKKKDTAKTGVSKTQLDNRNLRVKSNIDIVKFMTAKVNIEKQRLKHGTYNKISQYLYNDDGSDSEAEQPLEE